MRVAGADLEPLRSFGEKLLVLYLFSLLLLALLPLLPPLASVGLCRRYRTQRALFRTRAAPLRRQVLINND